MNFNDHSELKGQHAFLSASSYHWVNYSEEKLVERYATAKAAQKGTELHEFAEFAIRLGQKLPKTKKTLNMFVNDAISFAMRPEQILHYSRYSFGTADAISFRKNILRIHDLKTGITPCSTTQLRIYAALFCLGYRIQPTDIEIQLRIYQCNEVIIEEPEKEDILAIMHKIVRFNALINDIELEDVI